MKLALSCLSLAVLLFALACSEESTMCRDGFSRVDGECVPTDAGTLDAMLPDAQPTDAALDAADAAADATMTDADLPDAQTDDAGRPADAGPDAGPCGGACTGTAPVCDPATGTCVECTDASHCDGDTPACDTASNTCVACTDDTDCTDPAAPACDTDTHSCVACTDDADCTDAAAPVCDAGSLTCVECTGPEDCTDPTPVCQASTQACVECTDDVHCPDEIPRCDVTDTTCVECLGDADCTDAAAPRCDPAAQACVQCLTDADCTDPAAPRCDPDSHACLPCELDSDCDSLTGLGVCDASGGDGVCVECTGTDFDACDGVCDSRDRTCTSLAPESAGPCEPCVSDAQCEMGQLCVEMTFEGTDVGAFCLWREDYSGAGGPDGSCLLNGRPYINDTPATSLGGVSADICKPNLTTCQALNDFLNAVCTGTDDLSCGVDGLTDGECVQVGGGFLCNVPCESKRDCPPPAGDDRECDMQFSHDPPVCDFRTM
jgi:hypothetical protein